MTLTTGAFEAYAIAVFLSFFVYALVRFFKAVVGWS